MYPVCTKKRANKALHPTVAAPSAARPRVSAGR